MNLFRQGGERSAPIWNGRLRGTHDLSDPSGPQELGQDTGQDDEAGLAEREADSSTTRQSNGDHVRTVRFVARRDRRIRHGGISEVKEVRVEGM